MFGNYFKLLWRAIQGRADRNGTSIYEGSIKNGKDWDSSAESFSPPPPPPPPPPSPLPPQLPFVRKCPPPIRHANIAPIAPKPGDKLMALIYLDSRVIFEAKFNFRAISGLYEGGWMYLHAINQLEEIQQTQAQSDGVLQGTCIEPPVAVLEKIRDASRESVTLTRNASEQLETTWVVKVRCRCDAILLHRKRVRYVDDSEKSYEGLLYFEISHFTIQEVGNKRLSFYYNDEYFASGKCRFESLEAEVTK